MSLLHQFIQETEMAATAEAVATGGAHQIAAVPKGEVAPIPPPPAGRPDIVKVDALLNAAKELKDWDTLKVAVDRMMELQTEIVGWWKKYVSVRESPGRGGNKSSADRWTIPMTDAETSTGIANQQISKWHRRLKEPEKYREMLFGAAYYKAMAQQDTSSIATKWTGNEENYTPAKYVDAARKVLGRIDLDPASNAVAQKTIAAEEWYDETENGLLQEWRGTVWLNPPYSNPAVSNFIAKLCEEFSAGNVPAAVLLTNNGTDTKWWHLAAMTSSAVCFTAGRIGFYNADGEEAKQNTNGQTFFYFGLDAAAFAEVFREFGIIMARVSP